MKRISKLLLFSFILVLSFLASSMVAVLAVDEESQNDGYVYYAQSLDGVLTAYSIEKLSDNQEDIIINTKEILIDSKCVFSVEFNTTVRGRIYVEVKIDGNSDKMRAVRVNGNKLQNIDAEFSDEAVSFFIDEGGTYAVINVEGAVKTKISWHGIILVLVAIGAIAVCVFGWIGGKNEK